MARTVADVLHAAGYVRGRSGSVTLFETVESVE
jgi:hypothetical protein